MASQVQCRSTLVRISSGAVAMAVVVSATNRYGAKQRRPGLLSIIVAVETLEYARPLVDKRTIHTRMEWPPLSSTSSICFRTHRHNPCNLFSERARSYFEIILSLQVDP
jgi:hypothetical protein